jgi:hypothetical protein
MDFVSFVSFCFICPFINKHCPKNAKRQKR